MIGGAFQLLFPGLAPLPDEEARVALLQGAGLR
jgi:hypothetical protein